MRAIDRQLQRCRRLSVRPVLLESLVVCLLAGLGGFAPAAVGAEGMPPATQTWAYSPAPVVQASGAATTGPLRIDRPLGGFSQDRLTAASATSDEEPDFTSAEQQAPRFAQVLDGFSARWLHRLGTPVACRMVLCNGSCGDSEAACELTTALPESSSGCQNMPACDIDAPGPFSCSDGSDWLERAERERH